MHAGPGPYSSRDRSSEASRTSRPWSSSSPSANAVQLQANAAAGGPDDGLVREWPRPDVGTDKHRIYMMQWYSFAALALGLWVWFTFRRPGKRS